MTMIKLDDDLLREIGLGALPEEEKKKLLAHIYETLEMRVGMKLAEQMSDAQLAEFEQFIERNDEAGALHWLETNFPNYKDVVAAEFERLKGEIKQVAPQILASAAQAAAAAGATPPLPPSPPVQPMAQGYGPQPQHPGQYGQPPMPPAPYPPTAQAPTQGDQQWPTPPPPAAAA